MLRLPMFHFPRAGPPGLFLEYGTTAQLETTFLFIGGSDYDTKLGTVLKYIPEAESFNQLGVKVRDLDAEIYYLQRIVVLVTFSFHASLA